MNRIKYIGVVIGLTVAVCVTNVFSTHIPWCDGPAPVVHAGSTASSIGDINNDGTGDVGVAIWNSSGQFVQVEIRSGVDNALLHAVFPPTGESMFGVAVMPAGDFDTDGISDFAIASVMSQGTEADGIGIVRVYSGTSGVEVAYIKELPEATIAPEYFKLLGDQDGNKYINFDDVILLLSNISLGTVGEQYDLDINKDTIIDQEDVYELMGRMGIGSSPTAEAEIVNLLQTGEWMIEDPLWPGINTEEEFQPVQLGLVGCGWCALKCAKAWKKVAENCVDVRERIWEACMAIYGDCNHLDFSECVASRSRTALDDCIAQTAGVTTKCAKCIKKCMPSPT